MSSLTLLLLMLCGTGFASESELPAHDYHVSKTNLRYVAERRQLQVEMHLFVEDIEEALHEEGKPYLDLGTDEQHPDGDRYLLEYLGRHFGIDWNGERLVTEIVGYEIEDDLHGMWIYLSADGLDAPTVIAVNNTLLTETYADQKNIVKFFSDDRRLGTLLMDRANPGGHVNVRP